MATGKNAPTCASAMKWLRFNLGGKHALAALTGTDYRALSAAAHIIELWAVSGEDRVLDAFRVVVLEMQPKTRYFAYHVIAYSCEWSTRSKVWAKAGLLFSEGAGPKCEGEP